MARKRLKQKQSADLYFQGYHHREIIYDDAYVEALYLEDKVEPQWRRYKPKNLFGFLMCTDSSYENGVVSLDLENMFMSINKYMDTFDSYHKGLMDLGDLNVCGKYATKNCHDFKECQGSGGVNLVPFGINGTCYLWNSSGNPVSVVYSRFDYKTGEKIGSIGSMGYVTHEMEQYKKDTDADRIDHFNRIICPTANGCLLGHTEYHYKQFRAECDAYDQIYEVTPNGFNLLYTFEDRKGTSDSQTAFESCSQDNTSPTYGIHEGGYYVFPHAYNIRTNNQYYKGLYIYYASSSNPTEWNRYELLEQDRSYNKGGYIPRILYKNGLFYIYVVCNESSNGTVTMFRTKLFITRDFTDFGEVELPVMLDVPAFELENKVSYGHIVKSNYKIVRIILNNLDTEGFTPPTYDGISSRDIYEAKMIELNTDFLSLNYCMSMLSDGKNATKRIPYLAFSPMRGIIVYIDNMTFGESGGNHVFGYDLSGYYGSIDNTEELNDGDYVLGGRKVKND